MPISAIVPITLRERTPTVNMIGFDPNRVPGFDRPFGAGKLFAENPTDMVDEFARRRLIDVAGRIIIWLRYVATSFGWDRFGPNIEFFFRLLTGPI